MRKTKTGGKQNSAEQERQRKTGVREEAPQGTHPGGKPDEMKGFRPGPGNTGSMDGSDETQRGQVQHKI